MVKKEGHRHGGGAVWGIGSEAEAIVKQVTAPVGALISGVGSGTGDTITTVTGKLGAVVGGG